VLQSKRLMSSSYITATSVHQALYDSILLKFLIRISIDIYIYIFISATFWQGSVFTAICLSVSRTATLKVDGKPVSNAFAWVSIIQCDMEQGFTSHSTQNRSY